MKRGAAVGGMVSIVAAGAVVAQREEPPPRTLVRPLASLLVPGTGQLLAHQDRGAVYLAAEVYLVSRFLQLDHEAMLEARRIQNLAFDVARPSYLPVRRDHIFQYFAPSGSFARSGSF